MNKNPYPLDKDAATAFFRTLPQEQLLRYLEEALVYAGEAFLDHWLGQWQFDQAVSGKSEQEILGLLANFRELSLQGAFYAPFVWNSKNYSDVPEQTRFWYARISRWLDFACEQAQAQNQVLARTLLNECLHLLEECYSKDIVFAHDFGEWMVFCKYDYRAIHQQLQSDTV